MRNELVVQGKRWDHGPQNWGQSPIRLTAADQATSPEPNWDPTQNLLPTDLTLALPNFCCRTATTSAVILGSDPDSADSGWHRLQRMTESGSDPNITAIRYRNYQNDSW